MEYISLTDKLPDEEGTYKVNIKSANKYRESKAIWTPHVGFVLVDDSLEDGEFIDGWHSKS
ncbi:hypothetical protein [Aestuariibaculum sediminum]|uniref:Uncharacterized protein n=1 Tax=Aestuariibaculum sediminum TaxID=2770637 RepID=A0A8J6U7B9_9FLAO|nr:hypothetical protein [Aestuariibaculum sediminum]MBD0831705.1 hypothetical protein [Aestuariibaculum sediminum]